MAYEKLVTCCYCGTRAALVLRGEVRHELACSSCGAPISQMKHLKKPVSGAKHPKPQKKIKKKKRKSFDLFDEVFDFLEDVFD